MTWEIVFLLVALALVVGAVLSHCATEWKRVRVADAMAEQAKAACRRTELYNERAAAERLERQVEKFERLCGVTRSDNLAPVSTSPARPNFGFKPHIAVDNDHPEGAA